MSIDSQKMETGKALKINSGWMDHVYWVKPALPTRTASAIRDQVIGIIANDDAAQRILGSVICQEKPLYLVHSQGEGVPIAATLLLDHDDAGLLRRAYNIRANLSAGNFIMCFGPDWPLDNQNFARLSFMHEASHIAAGPFTTSQTNEAERAANVSPEHEYLFKWIYNSFADHDVARFQIEHGFKAEASEMVDFILKNAKDRIASREEEGAAWALPLDMMFLDIGYLLAFKPQKRAGFGARLNGVFGDSVSDRARSLTDLFIRDWVKPALDRRNWLDARVIKPVYDNLVGLEMWLQHL